MVQLIWLRYARASRYTLYQRLPRRSTGIGKANLHVRDREKLQMAMRLTCTAVRARVEERKEITVGRFWLRRVRPPCPKAGVGHGKIIGLEEVGLRLVLSGGDDKVVWNDWILVQYQGVCMSPGWYIGDKQLLAWMGEGIELWFRRPRLLRGRGLLICGLFRQSWTVAKLKLWYLADAGVAGDPLNLLVRHASSSRWPLQCQRR